MHNPTKQVNVTCEANLYFPEGTKVDHEKSIITLPDGVEFKFWVTVERLAVPDPTDISYDEFAALGCDIDYGLTSFEENPE